MEHDERKAILARAGATVAERDDDTIHLLIATLVGSVDVMANLTRAADVLRLDQVHVTGQGLTIGTIRRVARALGQVEDVAEVVVQGGVRRSGATPGLLPTPIRVRVR